MRASAPALIFSHLAVAGGVYLNTDRRPIDTEVKHTGFFQIDTSKVLATTVESLRQENKLLVFSYKGSSKVRTGRKWLWLFNGQQELIVPAAVNYYVDLSDLTLADVSYNETAQIVTVKLPKVTLGDIAFQPENATTINGGVLTYGEETVEALRKLNYIKARQAMVAQAQQPGLKNTAEKQAIANIERYFSIPLRIAGQPNVKVVATFR
ncbi:DUF4230 domain-containing protein [Sphingomonas sp. RS2018]